MAQTDFSLDAKYRQEQGIILLSGVQALVRLPLDQHRADRRAALNTATLISGYRGSPLGTLDINLQRNARLLREHQVVFMPGVNEDLGATAIFGSQLANIFPKPKYDGVLGMWYGKAPGVDRSGDIFKHANFAGVGRNGGVLAIAGDDPMAKSSTLPSHSEAAFYDYLMPVLFPGNIQEILDLGRYGFELSRYSGLWVGMKLATNVADGFDTAEVASDRISIVDPRFMLNNKPWQPTQNPTLVAPFSLQLEREIHEGRLEAAKAFAHANKLNRIVVSTSDDRIGIVAAGKTYYDLREALNGLGLDDAALRRNGIRLLKIAMLFPMEPQIVVEFARGLEEIIVIEEKRSFVELFMRDILYNLRERPRIVGKRDEDGNMLIRADGELDADQIAQVIARRVKERVQMATIEARVGFLNEIAQRPMLMPSTPRQSYFCSGCPHNRSTNVPVGSIAGAGIGCHGMVMTMERNTIGVTHMGGEGMQWVGMAPFTETPHFFQNLGDGTLFHSGSLAIRQAIASGVNITYKILYNGAVAMTGGQHADGALSIPDLTRELEAEGVKRIMVLSNEPQKFKSTRGWAQGVDVWHRDRLDEAQQILRDTLGTTVLIYDQHCAADLRRLRKRGEAVDPEVRIFINEAVCEGCGDCGVKSNCLSLFPVETEFGRKTQVHQSSCNKDYTCVQGDCPSFISIVPRGEVKRKETRTYAADVALPEPMRRVNGSSNIYMMGIGGTGVVTVNQILATAAVLDGKHVRSLDQTGLSQKGGPVVSHLKILSNGDEVSNKVASGEADCYLAFDVLTATYPQNLSRTRSDRTVAIVSTSQVPTGAMVRSTNVLFPAANGLVNAIQSNTRKGENVYLDAIGLAETLFNNHLAANMIAVGAAYQSGLLPLRAESIEQAIEINGAAVEMNKQAFRVGRRTVVEPDWLKSIKTLRPGALETKPVVDDVARKLIDEVNASGELLRLLETRVPELIAYQNVAYAREYVTQVKRVVDAERDLVFGKTELSQAVARYLFKLMAYKDEYEVARLHLKREVHKSIADQFGDKTRVQYVLHPPFLRALGMNKKIYFGEWFNPFFRLLRAMRRLRGTPLDVFGYAHMRRVERELVRGYRALIEKMLGSLSSESYAKAVEAAKLPDMIRGYENIKLENVKRYREAVGKLEAGD